MFDAQQAIILERLLRRGLLDTDTLALLREEARRTGRSALALALQQHAVRAFDVLSVVGAELGLNVLETCPDELDTVLISQIPPTVARSRKVVPWRLKGGPLEVLAAEPFAPDLVAELSFVLEREVRLIVADPDAVVRLVERYYPDERTEERLPGEARVEEASVGNEPGSIVRWVDAILQRAIREHASDVHFEPFEQTFRVRCRIDGVLREVASPPVSLALPVISRLKVMAGLDIAERRAPQDGRIELTHEQRSVDLRISTLPTQFGESVVLRVLDRAATRLDLAKLGLPETIRREIVDTVRRPNGILIVTGPTGSGKTTTLYGALREIDAPERKLLTVEDPVEYQIDGVMQVPVNPAAGLGFSDVLRSFLRHDPDVMMVGEIRDLETAEIAIQAALTGHLVLTSLHTNDAPGAIARLMDLGVEPYLIASTVEGVLAQRLVRRICPHCAREQEPDTEMLQRLGRSGAERDRRPFEKVRMGKGCPACDHTGYLGRVGVFEWLRLTEELRESISRRVPSWEFKEQAIRAGMVPLRQAGLAAVRDGLTTLEEIVSVG